MTGRVLQRLPRRPGRPPLRTVSAPDPAEECVRDVGTLHVDEEPLLTSESETLPRDSHDDSQRGSPRELEEEEPRCALLECGSDIVKRIINQLAPADAQRFASCSRETLRMVLRYSTATLDAASLLNSALPAEEAAKLQHKTDAELLDVLARCMGYLDYEAQGRVSLAGAGVGVVVWELGKLREAADASRRRYGVVATEPVLWEMELRGTADSVVTLRLVDCERTAGHYCRLSEGMKNLVELDLSRSNRLYPEGFLPASSAGAVRVLKAPFSNLFRVPERMAALRELNLWRCLSLDVDHFLPASSAANLSVLKLGRSTVQRLPGCLEALTELDVTSCDALDEEGFLPVSSGRSLRVLRAKDSNIARLPRAMLRLRCIDVEGCRNLKEDFLPQSSGRAVRSIKAFNSALKRLPPHMAALSTVNVHLVKTLHRDWLPGTSAFNLQTVDARESNLAHLPDDLCALEDLNVAGCAGLEPDFLPQRVPQLRWLRARGANVSRLPRDVPALEELDVRDCLLLRVGQLPKAPGAKFLL
ncbi:unnamed protein product [Pedinophyceae sp. YPF-701]|nr:unnamed protein product [Pedinophyceae sp. YPF-701]